MFSDCAKFVEKRGNLINPDTDVQITGSLIKTVEVPFSEASCSRQNLKRILSVPILFLSWYEAKKTCDKFLVDSLVGGFEVMLKFRKSYNLKI